MKYKAISTVWRWSKSAEKRQFGAVVDVMKGGRAKPASARMAPAHGSGPAMRCQAYS
jgi:hypothetical protein